MDLTSYITTLLSDNDTVIIPGFGAFISVYKPAVIKENEIIPPGKEIKFFPQIKNNDGLLAMQIARAKKISYDDAFKRIERATAKIILQLDKGENVAFGELGEFSYDENGEIHFSPFQAENPILQAGFETVSLEDVVEPQEEIQSEQSVEPEPAVVTEPEKVVEMPVSENEPEAEKETIQPAYKEEEKTVTETKVPEIQVTKPAEPEQAEKKKGLGWLWILLGIAIIAAVLLFMFNRSNKKNNQSQPVKTENVQPEIVQPDTLQPTDTTAAISPQPVSPAPKFHLVGGGFKSEENAHKFISQLKNKGIEGTLLGQKGNIYLVGIASFETQEEAFRELNKRMRENPDWKLWVYQK